MHIAVLSYQPESHTDLLPMGPDERSGKLFTIPPKSRPTAHAVCQNGRPGLMINPDKKKRFPAGCMCWGCPTCAKVLSMRVRKRLEVYEWSAKVEFTLDGDGRPTRENNLRLALGQRRILQFVRRYFKRKYGDTFKLRYARMHGTGDLHGRLHSHMLWDAPFIPREILMEHAEACGLGFYVSIRAIRYDQEDKDGAVRYVADQAVRYVADQPHGGGRHPDLPKGQRRFQSSDVGPYQPEEGWLFHRGCLPGCPCDWCGTVIGPPPIRVQRFRYNHYWEYDRETGEMFPLSFSSLALSSLVTPGETASATSPIPTEEPLQHNLPLPRGPTGREML